MQLATPTRDLVVGPPTRYTLWLIIKRIRVYCLCIQERAIVLTQCDTRHILLYLTPGKCNSECRPQLHLNVSYWEFNFFLSITTISSQLVVQVSIAVWPSNMRQR